MPTLNKQWLLASRPAGAVTEANFRLVETPVPAIAEGELLVRVHYLSLDPYMRGRMDDVRSYAPPQPLNEVMLGGTVGQVVESRHATFKVGDTVVGNGGWQQYYRSTGAGLLKVDASKLPESVFLGVVGMPGVTAWYGLNKIGQPKPGQTVVVSAASGAVGSVVGQLAKLAGCRAVGIAGGPTKCSAVVSELGFDACVDYRSASFKEDFKAATPDGVDVLFENVGGACFDLALGRMNPFGRVALCGLIAGYNGQDLALKNVRALLVMRLKVEGFIVSEHMEVWPQALTELGALVAQQKLVVRQTVAEGLEEAPRAFLGLLAGANVGKQLVKVVEG
jgi:NADPH-dependent curcumin reductase CurA